jgi:hypothetical protein
MIAGCVVARVLAPTVARDGGMSCEGAVPDATGRRSQPRIAIAMDPAINIVGNRDNQPPCMSIEPV